MINFNKIITAQKKRGVKSIYVLASTSSQQSTEAKLSFMHVLSFSYWGLIACSCFPIAATADVGKLSDAQANSRTNIAETLIVTGHQNSSQMGPVGVVSRELILKEARYDVAEIAQGLPGLQVDSRTNFAQDTRVSLRGFGARSAFGVRGIKLMVDGVPQSMPDGQGQLSGLIFEDIASVAVLRGPLASLYGSGAGGVVFVTPDSITETRARMSVSAGERGLQKKSLSVQGEADSLSGRLYLGDFTHDGERAHSAAERRQVAATVNYQFDENWRASLIHESTQDPLLQDPLGLTYTEWQEDPRQVNPFAEEFNTRKIIDNSQTALRIFYESESWQLRSSLWQGTRDVRQYLAFTGGAISGNGGVIDFSRKFSGATFNVTNTSLLAGRPWINTLGLEFSDMEDDRQGFVNNNGVLGDLRRDELGLVDSTDIYGITQWHMIDNWEIYGGARASKLNYEVRDFFVRSSSDTSLNNPDDSGSTSFDFVSFAVGVRGSLTEAISTGISAGKGYETPTLTEMAYSNNNQGLNIDLTQTQNVQYQWDLSYSQNAYALESSFFYIQSDDELVVDKSIGGRTTYRNEAQTRRYGMELMGHWAPSDTFSVNASSSFIDATFAAGELDGKQLPSVAKLQHNIQMQYQALDNNRLTLTLTGNHRSRVFSDDENIGQAPSHTRWDLSVGGKASIIQNDWRWWLSLRNITDENYIGSVIVNQTNKRSFEPAPRRHLLAGIEITL